MLVLFAISGDRCCLLLKLSDRRSRHQIGLVCLRVFRYERLQCVCLTRVVVITFCLVQMWTQLRGTARDRGTHDGAAASRLHPHLTKGFNVLGFTVHVLVIGAVLDVGSVWRSLRSV